MTTTTAVRYGVEAAFAIDPTTLRTNFSLANGPRMVEFNDVDLVVSAADGGLVVSIAVMAGTFTIAVRDSVSTMRGALRTMLTTEPEDMAYPYMVTVLDQEALWESLRVDLPDADEVV